MIRFSLATVLLTVYSYIALAQVRPQTVDDEGIKQAAILKKFDDKCNYGAYLIQQEIEFGTGKGINELPVVTANEKGTVEMVAIKNEISIDYLLPYNQFVKLSDYIVESYFKRDFRPWSSSPAKVSLTDESVFFDDSYGLHHNFPADKSGQRFRFNYNYAYTDAKYLARLFFHDAFPVIQHSISFKVPDWLELEITEKNFAGYKIKKEVKKEKGLNVYTYTAENLAGIKQEPSSLGKSFYLPHLVITVRTYVVNQQKLNGFKSLDDMYAWYNFLYKKANNQTDLLKAQVAHLTKGKTTDEGKVKAIYYWVQDNIRYIAFEEGYSGFVPQAVQEVFNNKYGDCKGMANLLTEMLKLAGFDAHFAWIGTREIPYDRTEIQSLCVDNHAISVLYLKGKTYFLDGTEKKAALGSNAYRIQGKNVLVQHGDKYKVENVPPPVPEENQMVTQASLALKGNKISGHVKMTFDGESKSFFHYIYNKIPANERKEFVTHMVALNGNDAAVTNIKTSDFTNRDIQLVLEGDVEISNQVTQVDKTCYVGIDFFPRTFASFIPEDDRQSAIDLHKVFVTKDEVILVLPAKAQMLAAPTPLHSSFESNSMEASYTAVGNKITLKKTMRMNSPVIHASDLAAWKAFLNKIKEFNRNYISIGLP